MLQKDNQTTLHRSQLYNLALFGSVTVKMKEMLVNFRKLKCLGEKDPEKDSIMDNKIIVLGLVAVGVLLYGLLGALIFRYINPDFGSTGYTDTYNTTFNDAFYFAVVTLTTVGYGDVVPTTDGAKIFVSIYILVSLVLIGAALEMSDFLFSIDSEEIDEDNLEKTKEYMRKARWRMYFNFSIVVGLMVISVIFFVCSEDYTFVNAFYFTVSTLSTVGYGDLSPRSFSGRLFSIFWVTLSFFTLFRLIGSIMDVILQRRKIAWRKAQERRRQEIRDHLSANPGIKNIRHLLKTAVLQRYSQKHLLDVLSKTEFILFRLEQEGRATHEDYSRLDKEFEELSTDVPHNSDGELSPQSAKVFDSIIDEHGP